MITIYRSDCRDDEFYKFMGRFFASLDIAKELEQQIYDKKNTTWYIFTKKKNVKGFVSVCEKNTHYFIDNLYVLPEYRNMNIANQFISHIVNDFTDKPLKCIACNPLALRIFNNHGFVEVGKNGKYKKLCKH